MNAWKPALAAVVIFGAGVATGALAVHYRASLTRTAAPSHVPPGPVWPPQRTEGHLHELAQRLGRELALTPTQRERVEAIVRESQERMRAVMQDVSPKAREAMRQMHERIRAELNPEQREEFEQLLKRREGGAKRGDKALPRPDRPAETPAPRR